MACEDPGPGRALGLSARPWAAAPTGTIAARARSGRRNRAAVTGAALDPDLTGLDELKMLQAFYDKAEVMEICQGQPAAGRQMPISMRG